jgi:hypothetical protein
MDDTSQIFWRNALLQGGSMYAIAKATGIDESNLGKMRAGKRKLSLKTIVRVCNLYHMNPWTYAIDLAMRLEPTMGKFTLDERR